MNNNIAWDNVFPEVPAEFHRRIINTLKSAEKPQPKRTARNKRFLLVLAAVLAVCSLTAGAVCIAQWNTSLANQFKADKTQQSALASAGTAVVMNQSTTANGLTVSVLQTLADKNGIYILLDITAPEGTTLTDNSCFDSAALTIDGAPGLSHSSEFWTDVELSENGGAKLPPNERYYSFHASNTANSDMNGKRITVGVHNLMTDKGKLDLAKVLDGSWELSWTLSAPNTSRVFYVNEPLSISGHQVMIKSLELSPISATLTLNGKDMLVFKKMLDQLDSPFNAYLLMKNGSFFMLSGMGGEGWSDSSKDLYVITHSFNKLLKVDDVSGIVFVPPGIEPSSKGALILSR